jgi:hypothetical protein
MDELKPQEVLPAVNIRYVGIGQLTLYLVSDDELLVIERGGPATTFLNLAIAFLSLGAGSLVALMLTSLPTSVYKFTVVIVLTVVSIFSGVVMLVLWWRFRKDASNVIARIRARGIPSAGGTVMEVSSE